MKKEAIAFRAVTTILSGETVLKDISFSLPKGERLVILGPSGCGKTTILRLICGFLTPVKGSISIFGQVVSKDGKCLVPTEKRGLSMVFQDLALWPHMSVWENLDFVLKAKGLLQKRRKNEIKKMLELVGLLPFKDRRPHELSGGQQQRVALARALVVRPRLLLLDEPFSSLHKALKMELCSELLAFQERYGFSMIHVTHDEEEARVLASVPFLRLS